MVAVGPFRLYWAGDNWDIKLYGVFSFAFLFFISFHFVFFPFFYYFLLLITFYLSSIYLFFTVINYFYLCFILFSFVSSISISFIFSFYVFYMDFLIFISFYFNLFFVFGFTFLFISCILQVPQHQLLRHLLKKHKRNLAVIWNKIELTNTTLGSPDSSGHGFSEACMLARVTTAVHELSACNA